MKILRNAILICIATVVLIQGGCATMQENATTCPVHQRELESELVILKNGQPRHEYVKARGKEFPFSGSVFTGMNAPAQTQQHGQAKV